MSQEKKSPQTFLKVFPQLRVLTKKPSTRPKKEIGAPSQNVKLTRDILVEKLQDLTPKSSLGQGAYSATQREEVEREIQNCSECGKLAHPSSKYHFIDPSHSTKVFFISDRPRYPEQAWPLSENAFHLNLKMAKSLGLEARDYQIGTLVKSFVGEERAEEAFVHGRGHLEKEIILLRPQVVIAYGARVTETLLKKRYKISEVHGQVFTQTFHDPERGASWKTQVIPIFHPEFLLINPSMKRLVWQDFQKVIPLL